MKLMIASLTTWRISCARIDVMCVATIVFVMLSVRRWVGKQVGCACLMVVGERRLRYWFIEKPYAK